MNWGREEKVDQIILGVLFELKKGVKVDHIKVGVSFKVGRGKKVALIRQCRVGTPRSRSRISRGFVRTGERGGEKVDHITVGVLF